MRCPMCKYNLSHLTSRRCPECGREFNPADLHVATQLSKLELWCIIYAAIVFLSLYTGLFDYLNDEQIIPEEGLAVLLASVPVVLIIVAFNWMHRRRSR